MLLSTSPMVQYSENSGWSEHSRSYIWIQAHASVAAYRCCASVSWRLSQLVSRWVLEIFFSEYDRIDLLQAQIDDVEFADKRLQFDEILRVEFRYPVEHTKIVVQRDTHFQNIRITQ